MIGEIQVSRLKIMHPPVIGHQICTSQSNTFKYVFHCLYDQWKMFSVKKIDMDFQNLKEILSFGLNKIQNNVLKT